MNNLAIDYERWKQLRQKWTALDAQGHTLKVDFQLVAHPEDTRHILAIDVIQHIDGKPVTETVQHTAGEAYAVLGIDDLSAGQLQELYKALLEKLYAGRPDPEMALVVNMSPTSPTSGELTADFVHESAPVQSRVQLNYQHYYLLSALRDAMHKETGECWSRVTVSYDAAGAAFRFA